MKNYKKQLITGIFAVSVGLLAGCAHKPQSLVIKPGMSQAEQQCIYKKRLAQQGVQVVQVGETVAIVLPSDRLFNPNSANVQSCQSNTLNDVAGLIKTYAVASIKVAGYSDDQDYPATPQGRKMALTTRQAQVVASYLWSQNINARFAYAEGLGSLDPIAFNSTVQGKAFNRRVVVNFRFYAPEPKKYN